MEKASQLVVIPSGRIGHLVSAVEMSKLLVSRHDQLYITVLIMKLPFDSKGTEAYRASLEASPVLPRVNFITLPKVPDLDKHLSSHSFRNQFIESHKTNVKNAVAELTESQSDSRPRLAGFVIDMFCTTMIDVADDFGVPTYMFFTSPAGFLGLLFNLQRIRDVYGKDVSEFKDSDTELSLPTFVNSVPGRVLPSVVLDKEGAETFLSYAKRDETQSGSEQAQQKSDILEWLDGQPPSSVVFLCFGSMGSFDEDQLREIAMGLERSGLRFLWSLRQPPPKGTVVSPGDYSDLTGVLPEGFLDRTAAMGKVIGWAPQVAILAHPAVGGFVSHCGWNSTLESLWFGVPMAAWPVYAEQQLNAFELVRELGLAVAIKMDYRRDTQVVVSAEEIERGIREVMEHDSDVRKRVKEMSEKGKKALMEAQLVFIPAPGAGHIVSTVEIAKQLVARDDQLFITILIMKLPFDKLFTNTDLSISHRISFVNLPESDIDTQGLAFPSFIKTFVQGHKTHVKDAVTKLLAKSTQAELAGFVIDILGFWFHLQSLHDEQGKDVAEITGWESELIVPSFINPVPAGVWPGVTRTKEGARVFIDFAAGFRQTKGILINTFGELEPHALRSLSDGKFPTVYPVGPLLNLKSDDGHVGSDQSIQKSDILEWLDDQPPSSVVFLCFGSMGSFGEAQVKEIACALQQSGQRFLWSLRQPEPEGKMGMPSDYADVKLVLPEGFLDRTAGIGKVIGWAPQVAILAHPAVGGFVSHCGWNSTLESLWCGVPIATWPLYAEQQLNAFGLVKELGLGVEIKMDYKQDSEVVSAEEIERGIKQVMEKDSDIRARVKEISEKSKKALTEGGSSYSSLGRFLDQI
ncbi:unnamed protein product [Prunus brigantina]